MRENAMMRFINLTIHFAFHWPLRLPLGSSQWGQQLTATPCGFEHDRDAPLRCDVLCEQGSPGISSVSLKGGIHTAILKTRQKANA